MLPTLVLVCLCFTVINAKPPYETLLQDIEHTKTAEKVASLDKILTKLIQHSRAIQQTAATRTLETRQSLASFPRECSADRIREMEIERKNVIGNYYNCSVLKLLEDIGMLGVDSTRYLYDFYKDTTVMVADALACAAAGFNPFTFVFCIFKAVREIPDEIEDIITLTENFKDALEDLLPQIYQGIETCFSKTTSDYEIFLHSILEKAKMCENSVRV